MKLEKERMENSLSSTAGEMKRVKADCEVYLATKCLKSMSMVQASQPRQISFWARHFPKK